MITIRQQLQPFWFKLDESDPQSASFHLRPLNQLQLHGAREHSGINEFDRVCISQAGLEHILSCGLIAWSNVVGEDGKELECKPKHYSMLPVDVLKDIALKILGASSLSEEQKKS